MPKILYVDDELVNLELFKVNFDKDYTVFTTNNAKEGFNILMNNEEIGVIITDLKMPEVNGIEFISEIKRKWPQKVCILLTAYMETDVMLRAINDHTVYKYLLKPWKKEMVKRIIDRALEIYESSYNFI